MSRLGPKFAKGRTADVFRWGERQILKLYREGFPPTAAEREAALARMAHAAGVRTPEVIDVVTVDNRPGVIFQRVDGLTMLQVLSESPWRTGELARQLAALQADLHAREQPGLPPLHQYLRTAIARGKGLSEETKAAVCATLDSLPDGNAVCHGDFHPANIIMSPAGPVIIDWVHATRGDPIADVANTALVFTHAVLSRDVEPRIRGKIDQVRSSFYGAYVRHYAELRTFTDEQLAAWKLLVAAAGLSQHAPDAQREALVALVKELLSGR